MTCHPGCLHHRAQCGGGNAREVPQGLRSQACRSNLGEAFSPKQGCCIRTCSVCSPDSETLTKPVSLTANSWMGLKLDWNIHLCLTSPFLVQDTNAAGTESTWHLEEYNAAKKLWKRLHWVQGQHILLNQMTMAYLIQNSFLPCSDVRWICSILTSGRSENKQNRNIECVLLTSLNKMEFCCKKDLHWTTTSTTFFDAPAWQTYVPLSYIRKKIW